MMPPKGLSGKDSFSTHQETDIYVFISYGKMAPKSPLKHLAEVDTIENPEREALKLLAETPGKPLYIIAKSGKMIMKSLLFPIYFFAFSIPKWTIIKLLPKVKQISQTVSVNYKENFIKLVQKITIREKVLNKLQNVVNPLKRSLDLLFNKFNSGLKFSLQKLNEVVKKIQENITSRLTLANYPLFQKVPSFVLKAFKTAKEKEPILFNTAALKALENMKSRIETSLNKNYIKFTEKLKPLKETAKNIKDFFNKEISKLKSSLSGFKKSMEKNTEAVVVIKNKVVEEMTPKLELVQKTVMAQMQILKVPFVSIVPILQHNFSKVQNLFQNVKLPFNFSIKEGTVQNAIIALKKSTDKIQSVASAVMMSFKRLLKDANSSCKEQFQNAKGKVLNVKEKAYSKCKQTFNSVKGRISAISRKVMQYLRLVLSRMQFYMIRFVRKVLHTLFSIWKWANIMVRFTGYLMMEIVQELREELRNYG